MEYNIGDRIVDDKRDLTIIGKKKQGGVVLYKYRCNVCGYECQDGYLAGKPMKGRWRTAHEIYVEHKCCACCSSNIIVSGINSIADTNPELSKYFMNGDERKYSIKSHQYVNMVCPNCMHVKENQKIIWLTNPGFSCPVCSSSISIGERIVYVLLDSLDIEFKKEFSFIIDTNKRYDFYLPQYNTIIEVHGKQHYKETGVLWGSLDSIQKNDEYKKDIAIRQGIDNYIIIDASLSDFEYIKQSILNSDIRKIIDFCKVNWKNIEECVYSNSEIKDACEYWENNTKVTIFDMQNKFHRSDATIYKWLNIGCKMGWCHKREHRIAKILPIKHIETNIYFHDAREASRNSDMLFGCHIPDSTIRYRAKQNKEFMYVSKEEFNNAYNNGNICFGQIFS